MMNVYLLDQIRFTALAKIDSEVDSEVSKALFCEEVEIFTSLPDIENPEDCSHDLISAGTFPMLSENSNFGWINTNLKARCIRFYPKKCKSKYAALKLAMFGCLSTNAKSIKDDIETAGSLISWIRNSNNQIILGAAVGMLYKYCDVRHIYENYE